MAKFPEPPGVQSLQQLKPLLIHYKKGSLVWRVHFSQNTYPTRWDEFRHFGPTSSRFDHHQLNNKGLPAVQDRGIMYVSQNGPTSIAEVFQATRLIDRNSGAPCLSGFRLQVDIDLLDLSGLFATQMGASAAIHSGPRPRAQRWSQQLYEAYPKIQGIHYCSSMYANAPVAALFERAQVAIPLHCEFHRRLDDPAMLPVLADTAKQIHYQLV